MMPCTTLCGMPVHILVFDSRSYFFMTSLTSASLTVS